MSKNIYLEVKEKNEKLMNDVFKDTVFFAFSNEQFKEGMKKIGAKDISELYKLGNTGGFYKKTDSKKISKLYKQIEENEKNALKVNGKEYAYQMFFYELNNHEFGYTMEIEDTLVALGYEIEDIEKSEVLYEGLKKALQKFGVTPKIYGIKEKA